MAAFAVEVAEEVVVVVGPEHSRWLGRTTTLDGPGRGAAFLHHAGHDVHRDGEYDDHQQEPEHVPNVEPQR